MAKVWNQEYKPLTFKYLTPTELSHSCLFLNWPVLFPENIILQVISGFVTLLIYFKVSSLKWNWSVHHCIFVSALLWHIWGMFNVNLISVIFVFHHVTAIHLWAVSQYWSSPQNCPPLPENEYKSYLIKQFIKEIRKWIWML